MLHVPGVLVAHPREDLGRHIVREPVDQRRRIVGRQLQEQLRQLVGRPLRQERVADLGVELAQRLHRETAVLRNEGVERGEPPGVREPAQDLGEVGRMLLLEEVDEVSGRTNPLQSLD